MDSAVAKSWIMNTQNYITCITAETPSQSNVAHYIVISTLSITHTLQQNWYECGVLNTVVWRLHTPKCHLYWETCFSDRASWIDYILITNLMHWLLFIHKILFSSTCFEHQVLVFRRIQLYTCSIWYCHTLWEFVVACRYAAWVRTDCRGKGVGRAS